MINKNILKTAFLGIFLVGSIATPPLEAQNPPAETFQPGPWQPLARVNPQRPITINIINQTGFSIQAGLTDTRRDPMVIADGQTRSLSRLESPLFLLVYINPSDPQVRELDVSVQQLDLNYEVRVAEGSNTVNVTIRKASAQRSANMTLNIDEFGGIYLY